MQLLFLPCILKFTPFLFSCANCHTSVWHIYLSIRNHTSEERVFAPMCAWLVFVLNFDLPWVLAAVYFSLSRYLRYLFLVVKLWGIQQIPHLLFWIMCSANVWVCLLFNFCTSIFRVAKMFSVLFALHWFDRCLATYIVILKSEVT